MQDRIYAFPLSWPSKRLARWYKGTGNDKERAECWYESQAFKAIRARHPIIRIEPGAKVLLGVVFVPPNWRRRDVAALADRVACAKAGILRYIGLDSSQVTCSYRMAKSPVPRGQVLCTLTVLAKAETAPDSTA